VFHASNLHQQAKRFRNGFVSSFSTIKLQQGDGILSKSGINHNQRVSSQKKGEEFEDCGFDSKLLTSITRQQLSESSTESLWVKSQLLSIVLSTFQIRYSSFSILHAYMLCIDALPFDFFHLLESF
jgi:hypothetical protein